MSSSSTVTAPRGSSPPRRSTSCMAFSSEERTSLLTGTASRHWRGHAAQTVPAAGLVADLVQEFVQRVAHALEASGLRHGQIGAPDVPAFCRDLVAGEPVFHLRAADPREP